MRGREDLDDDDGPKKKKIKIKITTPTTTTSKSRPVTIHDLFDIKKLIGEGAFGKVYLAIRKRDRTQVALKAIPISLPDSENTLQREVNALTALSVPGHDNVCKLYDQLRDNVHSYLAMEYVGGGELFEHLCDRGPFSEKDAAKFFRHFAQGLHYIHSKGYIHSDLKPENLMMGSWQAEDAQLKIVDFGFSVPDQDCIKLNFHGTVAYLPPECLTKNSTPRHPTAAGDMFAAGVIMYTVLTGTHPFDRTNHASDSVIAQAIVDSAAGSSDDNNISNNNLSYLDEHIFDNRTFGLSSSSIILMRSLLHPDPERRMTSSELCSHPWIEGKTATVHCLSSSHCKLKLFWQRRFRAAILKKFCHGEKQFLSTKEFQVIFQSMDLNLDGNVSLDELKRCMTESLVSEQAINDIFSSVDEDGSGGIDFDEFQRIMRRNFDGSYGSGSGNSNDVGESRHCCDGYSDSNSKNDDTNDSETNEKIIAISNEQVRFCIFQKYGRNNVNDTSITTTAMTQDMLRTIFDTMDINNDGTLCISEVLIGLRETPGLDEHMISSWADKTDTDLNGVIDFEEFCAGMMHNGRKKE